MLPLPFFALSIFISAIWCGFWMSSNLIKMNLLHICYFCIKVLFLGEDQATNNKSFIMFSNIEKTFHKISIFGSYLFFIVILLIRYWSPAILICFWRNINLCVISCLRLIKLGKTQFEAWLKMKGKYFSFPFASVKWFCPFLYQVSINHYAFTDYWYILALACFILSSLALEPGNPNMVMVLALN